MARSDSHSLMRMNSASNHSKADRQDLDLYVTPPRLVDELLDWLKRNDFTMTSSYWEPAVGVKHISNAIREWFSKYDFPVDVRESDIITRGQVGVEELDFLNTQFSRKEDRTIITNPPYKFANDFYKKACESVSDGNWVWMFVKIQFLETSGRYEIFKKYRPHVILGCSRRVECGKDGVFSSPIQEGGAAMYCWVGHHVGHEYPHTWFDWINTVNLNEKSRSFFMMKDG